MFGGPDLKTTNIGILKGGCDTCYLVKRGLCPQDVSPDQIDCTKCVHAKADRSRLASLIVKIPNSAVVLKEYHTSNPELVMEAFVPTLPGGKSVWVSWFRGVVTGRVRDVPA